LWIRSLGERMRMTNARKILKFFEEALIFYGNIYICWRLLAGCLAVRMYLVSGQFCLLELPQLFIVALKICVDGWARSTSCGLRFESCSWHQLNWPSYGLGDSGFESRQEQESFLFYKMSIRALGPTHPPVQWVQEFFPGSRPERESDH